MGSEERAAENRGAVAGGCLVVQERQKRRTAVVVSDVAARACRAAAEQQPPLGCVEQRLSGGLHPEQSRLLSAVVAKESDARDVAGGLPQVGLLPAVRDTSGFDEDDVGPRTMRGSRQQLP